MDNNDKIQIFEDKKIRTAWNEEIEEWYFSVVDVVGVLTEQSTQRGASNYWAKLKERLKSEGADQLLTNCQQLKMTAADGKKGSLMLLILNSCFVSYSPFLPQRQNHSNCGLRRLAEKELKKLSIPNLPLTER